MIGLDTSVLVAIEVEDAPKHAAACALLKREVLDANQTLAVAPQIILEFLHVVTDPKRFPRPMSMADALVRARTWWTAAEVRPIYPTAEANELFLQWMHQYGLGRKRIIDTHLAAAYWTCGARRILTSNVSDFSIYGVFEILSP